MTGSVLELKIDPAFVVRFIVFGFVMAFANIVPFLLTRGAYGTDGLEVAGWPLRCYDHGGFDGHCYFYPWAMAANIAIAVMASGVAAWIFRHGMLRTLRKWQTWGPPNAK